MRYKEYLEHTLSDSLGGPVVLPSHLHIVGHVALVNVDSEDPKLLASIGEVTLRFDKRISSVAVRTGPTTGATRKPSFRLVAGSPRTETVHVENGVSFKLDPLQITFSRGNRRERQLVRSQVRPGEVVVDMFACVGQFAFHAATVRNVEVTAIELNPETFDYLVAGVALNGFSDRVRPILGDCRIKRPLRVANRVYMGFLHETDKYLPYALDSLDQSGGFVHMHVAHPENEAAAMMRRIEAICSDRGLNSSVQRRRIKWYSPGIMHYVYDLQVSG